MGTGSVLYFLLSHSHRKWTDKTNHSVGVFSDLRKDFDTVDHQLLCNKLEFSGICRVGYQWIRSYVLHNYHIALCLINKSTLLPVLCGVPQGSILDPLLFTI